MTSHVYILSHKSEPRFKIGKANVILSRVRTIGLDEFDLKASIAIEAPSEKKANIIEKSLHRLFDNWRISSDLIPVKDGATEWFDAKCRPRLDAFIEGNLDLLGLKVHRDFQIEVQNPKLKEEIRKKKLEEAERLREARFFQKALATANRINKLERDAPLVAKECLTRLRDLLEASTFAMISEVRPGFGTRLFCQMNLFMSDASFILNKLYNAKRNSSKGPLGRIVLFNFSSVVGIDANWSLVEIHCSLRTEKNSEIGEREDEIIAQHFESFLALLRSLPSMEEALDNGLIPNEAMKYLLIDARPSSNKIPTSQALIDMVKQRELAAVSNMTPG